MLTDSQKLASALDQNLGVRVFDCRFNLKDTEWGRQEFSAAHIPGAIYAHLDSDLSGTIVPGKTGRHPVPTEDDLISLFSSWGLDPQDEVVVYDQGHGGIAARLWWLMRWAGHKNVSVLNGGWKLWVDSGLPTESAIVQYDRSDYKASFMEKAFLGREGVDALSVNESLVDSRDAQRYQGLVEPIDPVAGHIPGAVNLPFRDNLDGDGLWKSRQQLRQRFEMLAPNPVFYCGSGVTACHNILAYELAGLGEARLYAGSWSEWITDAQAPIVVNGQEDDPDA